MDTSGGRCTMMNGSSKHQQILKHYTGIHLFAAAECISRTYIYFRVVNRKRK